MMKGRENGHDVKLCIQVQYVSERAAPFFEVVFDDTLVELVGMSEVMQMKMSV